MGAGWGSCVFVVFAVCLYWRNQRWLLGGGRDLLNREGLVRGQQGRISGQRTNTSQGRESEMSTACSQPNEETADHSEGE